MTKKEIAERNIGMTFDFVRQVVNDPALAETIPGGAEIAFIDEDMPTKKRKEYLRSRKVIRYKVEHVFEPVKG